MSVMDAEDGECVECGEDVAESGALTLLGLYCDACLFE